MFKVNDVVRYRPEQNWCRHGIAVILGGEGWAYAKDTYWGIGDRGDSGYIRKEYLHEPVLIGNTDDFAPSQYRECRDFREEDQFYIPVGGGSAQIWYRKGAEPQPDLVYARLQYELEKAEGAIRSADLGRAWVVRQINEHIAKHGIPVNGKEEA